MRSPIRDFVLAALAVAYGVHGQSVPVALSDWKPQANGLTPQCNAIYHETIQGCVSTDFATGSTCTASCIAGLISLANSIYTNCGSSAQNNKGLVGVFLNGKGVGYLCHGVLVSTMASSPASTPPSSAAPASSDPAVSSAVSSYAPSSATSSSADESSTSNPQTSTTPSKTDATSGKASSTSPSATHKISQSMYSTQTSFPVSSFASFGTPTAAPSTSAPASTSSSPVPANGCTDNGSPFGGGGCSAATHSTIDMWLTILCMALASSLLLV